MAVEWERKVVWKSRRKERGLVVGDESRGGVGKGTDTEEEKERKDDRWKLYSEIRE